MRRKLLLPYVLLVVLVLTACSGPGGFKADFEYQIEPFEFTNQHSEKVSLDDLQGQVWLAQFIFTKCTSVCPPMMMNMVELEARLADASVEEYKLVSFSVDPVEDTPQVLQEYLDIFDVKDQSKWEMLTGYTQEYISQFATKSFKTLVIDDPNSDQVTHDTKFFLVNQQGQLVKMYSGNVDVPYEQIVKDMKALIKEGA
ncbi:SCO family protein [Sporosarcina sp. YIM B06819]|uniref:SCO family protein n=1 Tax=Sporosarcina sp. YIM B06819 TaxID=3081769 RepID=UPI00298D2760|nr:SCO family protein [Sporosarcina sp. YIM B06819]